jgi:outer membrane immunogenic protein
MKRILQSGVALIALIGAANAADLPPRYETKAPPPAPTPIYRWTGLYVGAGFGYGMWDTDTSFVLPAAGLTSSPIDNGGRGWVGQVVAGYDYQFAVANFNLVAGVFGDYDFGHMTGTMEAGAANGVFSTLGGVEKERSYWDAGGRIGVLITPQILSYWNGGYTQARFDGINLAGVGALGGPFAPMSVAANTYHGWFTGGGVETQVTSVPGLFFNTEYRYASYDSATLPISNAVAQFGTPASLKFEPHVQTVMSGLRYKFNWPQ